MMQLWSKTLLAKVTGPYQSGELIFESSTPGIYEIELLTAGIYEVYCIGGGAGALRNNLSNSKYTFRQVSIAGGSGAGYIGRLFLSEGKLSISIASGGTGQAFTNNSLNYGVNTAALAGGTSSIGTFVSAGGGKSGSTGRDQMNPSYGGSIPTVNVEESITILKTGGNTGECQNRTTTSVSGGASVYENYGKGGDVIGTSPQHGSAGYVKIVYLGK